MWSLLNISKEKIEKDIGTDIVSGTENRDIFIWDKEWCTRYGHKLKFKIYIEITSVRSLENNSRGQVFNKKLYFF